MLQSAIWKLGRKQRLLLPLATSLRSPSRAYKHSASPLNGGADQVKTEKSHLGPRSTITPGETGPKGKRPSIGGNLIADDEAAHTNSASASNSNVFTAKFAAARSIDTDSRGDPRPREGKNGQSVGVAREPSRPSPPYSDEQSTTRGRGRSTWLESKVRLRPQERKSQLSKSWANCGPEVLYHKVLYPGRDQYKWWERVASLRSYRLPIVLLQMSIRQTILTTRRDKRYILDLLPKGRHRRALIEILGGNGYSRDEVGAFVHIIQSRTDHEACERFLRHPGHKPIFLLRYLLRQNSDLSDIFILHELIRYISITYDGRRDWERKDVFPGPGRPDFPRAQNPMLNMSPSLFGSTLALLLQRCLEVESRFCLEVVDIAMQYILNIRSWDQHPEKLFHQQCLIFNDTLAALGAGKGLLGPKTYRSFPHIWEAQRKLLTMSASLERPLLLNRRSFFAVKTVLAGQQKNHVEQHASKLHAETWPPYLEAGDGMDERTEPEENWSRSVQASVLAQEAGFDNTPLDDSLDILQGRAPDGTPTIQQRTMTVGKKLSPWVAFIRATRNAEEAWGRFRSPPEKDMTPGVDEYAAMFAKLLQPDVRSELNLRPGDRPYNFPTRAVTNLSDFGRARLQPPNVSVLYSQMLKQGIQPRRRCLEILVWHADSLELAQSYLQDSGIDFSILTDSLLDDEHDAIALRKVHMPLFAAYIRVLCREDPNRNLLERATLLCSKRFKVDHHNRQWAPRLWGMILRAVSEPWQRKERPIHKQLSLYNQLLGFIQANTPLPLSSYLQFCKSLRKTVGRELAQLASDLEGGRSSPLATLFESQCESPSSSEGRDVGTSPRGHHGRQKMDLRAIEVGSSRMKLHFQDMVRRESEGRHILQAHKIDPVDQMLARRDPVRADDAHEHLRTLAFVGEFEEMVNVLGWLVREWSDPALCEALHDCEQVPQMADFTDVLCAFRLLAEPMLDAERVAQLRQTIEQANAGWVWPDDEAVDWYRDMQAGETTRKLAHVLEWVRYRQHRPGLEAEFELEPPETWVEPKKEAAPQPRFWMPASKYAY